MPRRIAYLFLSSISLLLIATSCVPAFPIFVSNKSSEAKEVKVTLEDSTTMDFDSLRFFSNKKRIGWMSHMNSKTLRTISKDTDTYSYKFTIYPGEATLLLPERRFPPVRFIVIDKDTTFNRVNNSKETEFTKRGFRFIRQIER